MTKTPTPTTKPKRRTGGALWWIVSAAFALWSIAALSKGQSPQWIGFMLVAVAALPPVQAFAKTKLGAPAWAPATTVIGLALAAFMATAGSTVPEEPSAQPKAAPNAAEPNKQTQRETLPARLARAGELADLYIGDDLHSQAGHEDDYATGMLPNELKQLDDWGMLAFEAIRAGLEGSDKAALDRLLTRAAVYQTREFPRYREGFAKAAHNRIWTKNIEVSVVGTGNRTLRLTSTEFASNEKIAAMMEAVREGAERVRFDRIEFRAYEGGRRTFFDLVTPPDNEVGVWVGMTFMSASRPGARERAMTSPRSSSR